VAANAFWDLNQNSFGCILDLAPNRMIALVSRLLSDRSF